MPVSDELINECKQLIRHRAAQAGIKFLDNDLIVVQKDHMATIVLRRQLLGYERDENDALALDENGEPVPMFMELMWFDVLDSAMGMSMPRLRMRAPWLVLIILGDEIFTAMFP